MNTRFCINNIIKVLIFLFISLVFFVSCNKKTSLKDAYKDYFYFGTALNTEQIEGKDSNSIAILDKQFNAITPENVMKWEVIHPEKGRYDFELADRFVELGEKNNIYIVGHVLIWHSQTPQWVFQDEKGNQTTPDTLLERMRGHIKTVVGRYKGRVDCWDVVNEAIDDQGQVRKNVWFDIMGIDYVQKAFEFTRESDPDAILIYNDYSLPNPVKRDAVIKLVNDIRANGAKVDGIGMQGHYHLDYPELDDLESSIVAFAENGLKVMITELDINVLPYPTGEVGADINLNFELQKEYNPYPDELPDSMQLILANRYVDFFNIFNKHHDKISRVTIWGICDSQSWLNNWPINGRANYPLLFGRNYQPKKAYYSIIEAADKN